VNVQIVNFATAADVDMATDDPVDYCFDLQRPRVTHVFAVEEFGPDEIAKVLPDVLYEWNDLLDDDDETVEVGDVTVAEVPTAFDFGDRGEHTFTVTAGGQDEPIAWIGVRRMEVTG